MLRCSILWFSALVVVVFLASDCSCSLDRSFLHLAPRDPSPMTLQRSSYRARHLRGGSDAADPATGALSVDDTPKGGQLAAEQKDGGEVASFTAQELEEAPTTEAPTPSGLEREPEQRQEDQVPAVEPVKPMEETRQDNRPPADPVAPPHPRPEPQVKQASVSSALSQEQGGLGVPRWRVGLASLQARAVPIMLSFSLGMAVAYGVAKFGWQQEDDLDQMLTEFLSVKL
ncbi:hypothetical protein GUITHDRAFT_104147 [Guillardia theta CCMP2712]|uniref:Transmembrane protein n=2 Tax=Guillardia theta TaxID=55529 RepID=L1JQI3_GUITC|nr:hypothetical protein GUITHDRAFT_104147 [Guillardia theta CCMP2712]EKX50338.1 hypothetical protein GUITHDRAFT_104147 [Guillardia theta CCMP2712]|eukprot:XP_005837318.1 hypothetical protein GUITHDRAFT_104147 [Guillardia theta CCMP2712]